MRDIDVRAAMRLRLGRKHAGDASTRIVEEMGIWGGAVRVDVAVINGELTGYELKSARDTLVRLPAQANLYNQVFDRVTLVTAENHLEPALAEIPSWWGIIIARTAKQGPVQLIQNRKTKRNPSLDALQIARLLWRDEAISVLTSVNSRKGYRSASAEILAERLAAELSLPDLRLAVRTCLKLRSGWLGQQ